MTSLLTLVALLVSLMLLLPFHSSLLELLSLVNTHFSKQRSNGVLDTFASKTAAIGDDTADASVGNVTGSNAVNVFLGIGIAWTMAAFYWSGRDGKIGLEVTPGTLSFSVVIFCVEALLAIALLLFRRRYGTR